MAHPDGLIYTAQLGDCPDATFEVVRFDLHEQLSSPFELTLELAARDNAITARDVLDRSAVFAIWQGEDVVRHINGIVSHFSRGDEGHRHSFYTAVIRPPLHRLSLTRNTRIFQHQALPDIVTRLLEERGLRDFALSLRQDLPVRDFRLQYRESDLAFIERLLAEAGISYRFELNGDTLQPVFEDDPRQAPELGEFPCQFRGGGRGDLSHIRHFSVCQQSAPAAAILKGYDCERPDYPAEYRADRIPPDQRDDYEDYDLLGAVADEGEARQLVNNRLRRLQSQHLTGEGKGTCAAFTAGAQFQLCEHELDDANQGWRLIHIRHTGTQALRGEHDSTGTTYHNEFNVVPAGSYWLPESRKPAIDGPQIARVVGPEGEEIHCDEQGRVQVRFAWERDTGNDDSSRVWLRVVQGQAGGGFGLFHLPRVGHEVLVSFLEDDPDRPVITGTLHHASNVHPWSLPEHKARSGLRTRSHNGEGHNELHFDDTPDSERVFLHAQKNLQLNIGHDRIEQIENERHLNIANESRTAVAGDDHEHIEGNDNARIGGDCHQSAGGSSHLSAGQGHYVEAGQEIHHSAGTKVVIEAGAEITLEAGGSFLKVDPSGVILTGPAIKMNSGGAPGSGTPVSLSAPTPPGIEATEAEGADGEQLAGVEQRAAFAGAATSLSPGELTAASEAGQMTTSECQRRADDSCGLGEDCRCQ